MYSSVRSHLVLPSLLSLTFSLTTWSKASSLDEKSAETCLTIASHHAGEEKRCKTATLHKSMSTVGRAVGSVKSGEPCSRHRRDRKPRTLSTEYHTHGKMPLLANERRQSFRQSCHAPIDGQVLLKARQNTQKIRITEEQQWQCTLCASSTTRTFPVLTSARMNMRVTISKREHALAGSTKGSERSTIVS